MNKKKQEDILYRAVESRDARFDGKFFTGVRSTKIYCRPICPGRPKRKNIVFFESALLAEREGYRPCLRCRPEVAPQSPAWLGSGSVVQRALRLIQEGQLFGIGERDFAKRFGVSERHLRRLFTDELGVTPKKISDNQRLNFARTLVLESNISFTEIAFTSGFNSIRRFNDAFRTRFSKKPSELRKSTEKSKSKGVTTLYLKYRPPFDWNAVLNHMGAHAAPGIERVFNSSYQRLVKSEPSGKPLLIKVTNHPDRQSLKLELIGAKTQQLFSITQKIRRMFDLNSDPLTIGDTFSRSVWHSKLLEKSPGLRIASSWDPFETAVATILGQFVSSSHAQKLLGQLILETGEELDHDFDVPLCMAFPTPEALSKAKLTTVKTTQQRKEAIRSLAKSVLQKRIDLHPHADLNKLRKDLRQIKGVGPWTVEYVCLRAMGDSNAFPDKDLIISRAIEKYPQILKTDVQPWRSYLALLIWKNISA